MKKHLISAILVLSFFSSLAQLTVTYELKGTDDFFRMNQLLNKTGNKELTLNDIDGSPYLDEEFINGTVFTTEKTKYENVPLRYNLYNGDLEFKNPAGELLVIAKPEIVEYAAFGDYRLVYCNFYQGPKPKQGFLLLIEEGKASLLSKLTVILKEGSQPAAYKDAEPPQFVRRADEYYIRMGTGIAKPAGNKKSVLEAFPDNQDKIDDFISKNKIKLNKTEGLAAVVKFYNTL